MSCGCNLRLRQQNIHNTLFSRIVSTKLINTTSRIPILLEKMMVKWQRYSLPITKPKRLTVFDLPCQVNLVDDLFQIIYAKISKQASSLRIFLLISYIFHACYTPGQSSILICVPRYIFGEKRTGVKLYGAFAPFFRFPIFMPVMFHALFFQTHAMKCCQYLVGNVAKNSRKVCLFPQKTNRRADVCVLSAGYLLTSYHT
jgi:hypothetical protein